MSDTRVLVEALEVIAEQPPRRLAERAGNHWGAHVLLREARLVAERALNEARESK